MAQTARIAYPKTPFYRSGTGQYNYEYAEITLFARLFRFYYDTKYYINNLVLIDWA